MVGIPVAERGMCRLVARVTMVFSIVGAPLRLKYLIKEWHVSFPPTSKE